jgi:hypothetical protein
LTAPICFLDTETDGVHPDRKVWEVAAIRRDPDGTQTEFHAFIDVQLDKADPFGLRVGKFYDRHPYGRYLSRLDAVSPYDVRFDDRGMLLDEDAAHAVARITHGAHIVGAVPNFDTEVLGSLLRSNGLTPAWHYHLVDVENLAVGYLAGIGSVFTPPWNSDRLSEALGLEPVDESERHTALGDARWAMRIYDAVMNSKESA